MRETATEYPRSMILHRKRVDILELVIAPKRVDQHSELFELRGIPTPQLR
jgi:hypothetical protein